MPRSTTRGQCFRDRNRYRTNHLIGVERVKYRDDRFIRSPLSAFYRTRGCVSRVVTQRVHYVCWSEEFYVRAISRSYVLLHDRSSGVTKDRRAGFLQSGFTSGRCVAHKLVRTHAATRARAHNVTSRWWLLALSPDNPEQPGISLVVLSCRLVQVVSESTEGRRMTLSIKVENENENLLIVILFFN